MSVFMSTFTILPAFEFQFNGLFNNNIFIALFKRFDLGLCTQSHLNFLI